MRTLLLVLALSPALCQAALVIDSGAQEKANASLAASPNPALAAVVTTPAVAATVGSKTIAVTSPREQAVKLASSTQPVTVANLPIEPAPTVALSAERYRLIPGVSIQQQLNGWAKHAGWSVSYNVPDSWLSPGKNDYGTDFETAVAAMVSDLHDNGVDIYLDIWEGNQAAVLTQLGAGQ
jgi:OOP family OmpA-OmpF porin